MNDVWTCGCELCSSYRRGVHDAKTTDTTVSTVTLTAPGPIQFVPAVEIHRGALDSGSRPRISVMNREQGLWKNVRHWLAITVLSFAIVGLISLFVSLCLAMPAIAVSLGASGLIAWAIYELYS